MPKVLLLIEDGGGFKYINILAYFRNIINYFSGIADLIEFIQ